MNGMAAIARPYALAAFDNAIKKNAVLPWEAMLRKAALIAKQMALLGWLSNPLLGPAKTVDLFCHLLASILDEEKKNFISLLVEYKRIAILPGIADLFSYYRAEYEKNMTVTVISAKILDESWQKRLADKLSQRFQKQVSLDCKVDPGLIGGARVEANGKVIDGSIRGQLDRLLETL